MTSVELRQERAKIVRDERVELLDIAAKEKRGLTPDEETKYQAMEARIAELDKMIETMEKAEAREKDLGEPMNRAHKPEPTGNEPPKEKRATDEYEKAFRSYLFTGKDEARALQMDSDTAGGYTVVPQKFIATLIKDLDNASIVRPYATVHQVPNAASLGAPALDADIEDGTWTSEIGTRDEDTALTFGKRELKPVALAKLIKVSKKLLRASALSVDEIVRQRMAYKFAVTEENAFLNGTGDNQPLGVFTASANGISTGQDVSTGNTATEIKFDGIIECKYTLKEGYLRNARWIFSREAVKNIRKLKDGEGRYVWDASVQAGQPDKILGLPVHMSEYAPHVFTTGKYVGILGDFSFYWIADALDMQMQVLVELYAATNQNGYIGLKETDGMPVLENAFARVKLG